MIDVHCPEGGRHEFEILPWPSYNVVGCKHCDFAMGLYSEPSVLPLLNAAVQLTADEATATVSMFEKFDWPLVNGAEDNMDRHDEYARRWRGDTEEDACAECGGSQTIGDKICTECGGTGDPR